MSDRWRAGADTMRQRRTLVDRVGSDLSRNEQETDLSFFGDADRAQVTTYAPTIVRSLLRHAYADIEWLYIAVPDGRNQKTQPLSDIASAEGRGDIEGIRATLPLGALSIKGKPRRRDRHSGIVTTPEDVEELAEVFDG